MKCVAWFPGEGIFVPDLQVAVWTEILKLNLYPLF